MLLNRVNKIFVIFIRMDSNVKVTNDQLISTAMVGATFAVVYIDDPTVKAALQDPMLYIFFTIVTAMMASYDLSLGVIASVCMIILWEYGKGNITLKMTSTDATTQDEESTDSDSSPESDSQDSSDTSNTEQVDNQASESSTQGQAGIPMQSQESNEMFAPAAPEAFSTGGITFTSF